MAHFNSNTGINQITGALSKKREQGVCRISVTRKKHIHDPLTGEIVAEGPNELYLQHLRDYTAHPLSAAEQTQRQEDLHGVPVDGLWRSLRPAEPITAGVPKQF